MQIKYFKKPFYHTIIYNFFNDIELQGIFEEINSIEKSSVLLDDVHHNKVNANSYSLDILYDKHRTDSIILQLITKIYQISHQGQLDGLKNPFLNYIGISNCDNTVLHAYADNSSYFEHQDNAVLSFLYPLHVKPFTGGDLMFGNYKPKLDHNCLLIFPSYQQHHVTPIQTSHNGIVRYSINQRIYIRNE